MRRPDPGRQVDVGIFHAREGSDAGKRPEALYSTADVASGCLHRRGGRVVGLLFLTSREGCDRRLQRCGAVDLPLRMLSGRSGMNVTARISCSVFSLFR